MNVSPRNSRLSSLLAPSYRNKISIGVSSMNAAQQERFEQLLAEFSEIDANGDASLTYSELCTFLTKKSKGDFNEQVCLELFNKMDKDHNSEVTTKEFILNYIETEDFLKERIEDLKKQTRDSMFQLEDYKKKLIKAKGEEVQTSKNVMVDSVLTVNVIEGMNLRVPGTSPFVELTCEKQIIETDHKPGDPNPMFKEVFTFQIQEGNEDLQVLLKDFKSPGSNRVLGRGYYSLADLRDQMRKDVIVDLNDPKTEAPIGRIHLELQWIYSKIKYFEDIISQLENELAGNKADLESYQTSIQNLRKPFGVLEVGAQLISQKNLEKALTQRIENIAYGIVGREVRWPTLLNIFMFAYLVISILQMFIIPDFLNVLVMQVCVAIFGILQSVRRIDVFSFKMFSGLLITAAFCEGIWLILSGRVRVM